MMLRATKPLDFIAPSPTVPQRAKMRAPEYLPLIMEPRSKYFIKTPLEVKHLMHQTMYENSIDMKKS